jgi:hypothetical protein
MFSVFVKGAGQPGVPNGMYILCLRKSTHLIFYNILCEGHRVKNIIQKYVNPPDEYHSSAMLICPPYGPIHYSESVWRWK